MPDLARPTAEDSQFYTGALWLMATGSWQVRIDAEGSLGSGTLSVPVPALPQRVLAMQTVLAAILIPVVLVLAFGIVSIIGRPMRARAHSIPARCQRTSAHLSSPAAPWRLRLLIVLVGALLVGLVLVERARTAHTVSTSLSRSRSKARR